MTTISQYTRVRENAIEATVATGPDEPALVIALFDSQHDFMPSPLLFWW